VQKLLLAPVGGQKEKPKSPGIRPVGKPEKMKKKTGPQKAPKKVPKETLLDMVVRAIRGSGEGITTAALKEKTGLAEGQIWSIVYRAEKQGKKTKRGIYMAA
jgi:hypothetical protein